MRQAGGTEGGNIMTNYFKSIIGEGMASLPSMKILVEVLEKK